MQYENSISSYLSLFKRLQNGLDFLGNNSASAPNLETLNLSCILLNDILDNDIVISRDYSGLIYAGNGSNAIKTSAEHLRHLEFTFGIKE